MHAMNTKMTTEEGGEIDTTEVKYFMYSFRFYMFCKFLILKIIAN